MDFRKELFQLQDLEYKNFHCRLIPNIPSDRIIGVRTPALRALAKKNAGIPEAREFLTQTPHGYYDENNLHAALIDYGRYGFEETLRLTEEFLPLIDNWATCDMFNPAVFKRHTREILERVPGWLNSAHTYTVRFGINCLMRDALDTYFDPIHFDWLNNLQGADYYIKMAVAWYYSVALVKQWDAACSMLAQGLPDAWIQNKSIQKARESRRLTVEQKQYLLTYKK